MNKVHRRHMVSLPIILSAGIAFALAFTFSCSGGDDGGNTGETNMISSSSSVDGSSSSNDVTPSSSSIVSSSSNSVTVSSSSIRQDGSSSSAVGSSSSNSGVSSSSVINVDSGTFLDSRDNKTYKWVKIGDQTWMAENLNYETGVSACYDNNTANCTTYGRLYNWATAKTACSSGWHLPSDNDWNTLMAFIHGDKGLGSFISGTSDYAGKYLKATSGWNNYNGISGNGEDTYGFLALPGGLGTGNGFVSVGDYGYWWSSSSEYDSNYAYYRGMYYNDKDTYYGINDKDYLFGVRCVQD